MDEVVQTTLPCPMVQQADIDQLIHSMIEIFPHPENPITKLITLERFLFLCHRVVDVLKKDDTLQYIHDPQGVGVIGDTHGEFVDLLRAMRRTGWPHETTLLFLGDYVDRGPKPLEVILFLFALKIRYPKRVILLRGNHETIEINKQYKLPDVCSRAFPDCDKKLIFYNLNNAFDYLPIAAIISDQIYCCHGGISQFAQRRADIARIKRPTRWLDPNTNVLNAIILTDTLWADPIIDQREAYVANRRRGMSYTFNHSALMDKLDDFDVRAVLRAHQPLKIGCTNMFDDGSCWTIHTSPNYDISDYLGGTIKFRFNPENNELTGSFSFHVCCFTRKINDLISTTQQSFEENRTLFPLSDLMQTDEECETCTMFRAGVKHSYMDWPRCIPITRMMEIIQEYQCSSNERLTNCLAGLGQHPLPTTIGERFSQLIMILAEEGLLPVDEDIASVSQPDYDFRHMRTGGGMPLRRF